MLLSCAAALLSLRLGLQHVGPVLGAFLAGAVVGLLGNIFARISNRPGNIMTVPGLLLLVPGSLGLQGFSALMSADVLSGVDVFFNAMMTAVALTMGLILASVLVAPKSELESL